MGSVLRCPLGNETVLECHREPERIDQIDSLKLHRSKAGWRKGAGVEPTRDVERLSPDLKSGRPTGVRFPSSRFGIAGLIYIRTERISKRSQ